MHDAIKSTKELAMQAVLQITRGASGARRNRGNEAAAAKAEAGRHDEGADAQRRGSLDIRTA